MQNGKNIIIWSLVILAIILGIWGYQASQDSAAQSDEPIKIGVIAPLSGKGATRGESTIMGLKLAQKKIEEQEILSGRKIELVYQDVALDKARNAPSAFNQLVEFENVVAIIGPAGSNVALSITPLVDKEKIPVIIHTASASAVTKDNEFVFRLWPTDEIYANAMIPRLETFAYERIAILTATIDNTLGFLGFLEEEIDFVANEKASQDSTDFRTQLAKIKATQPDLLILNLFTAQNGLAAKQAREIGIDIPFVTNSVTSTVDLEVGPEYLEGAWLPQFAGYGAEVRAEFVSLFGNNAPDPDTAAAAHDALLVLAQAIGEVGTDGERMKDYIYQNKFTGSIGDFSFAKSGNGIIPLKFEVIRNGEFVDFE